MGSVTNKWWQHWKSEVLSGLIPIKMWREQFQNVEVGDIVLLINPKFKINNYQVARVTEVHVDAKD